MSAEKEVVLSAEVGEKVRGILARLADRTNFDCSKVDTGPHDEHYFEAMCADEETASGVHLTSPSEEDV